MLEAQGFRLCTSWDRDPYTQVTTGLSAWGFDHSSQARGLPKYACFNEGPNPALKSLPAASSHTEVHHSQTSRTHFAALPHPPQACLLFAPSPLEITPPDIICHLIQLGISQRNKLLDY